MAGKAFKMMKAATVEGEDDYHRLQFPMYGSPKYDGIRIGCHDKLGPVTNTLKGIPNHFVRAVMSAPSLWGLDGEIVVGNPTKSGGYSDTQSAFSTREGEPAFTFYVFDDFASAAMACPFAVRIEDVRNKIIRCQDVGATFLEIVTHTRIENLEEFEAYCEACVIGGYEGACFRSAHGKYKFGRSTLIEGHLLKFKPFADAEAIIDGFEPLLRNMNEARIDARGLQVRGYSKANKIPDESMVGKVLATVINGPYKGCKISVGSGLDDNTRLSMKQQPDAWLQKTFTFKYQKFGSKDLPRTPIWKGIRHDVF